MFFGLSFDLLPSIAETLFTRLGFEPWWALCKLPIRQNLRVYLVNQPIKLR